MIKKYKRRDREKEGEAMDEIMTGDGKQGVSEGVRGWERKRHEDEMGKIFMGVWKKEITALKNDGEERKKNSPGPK